jgi:hypothetical protein
MPHFLTIDTRLFTQSIIPPDQIHPFLQLKEQGSNKNNSFFNRIQCVDYMLRIPYKDHLSHTIDVVKSIQDDLSIPIYKRYSYWSTQQLQFKLNDHIVYEMHSYFFNSVYSDNIKYPFDLIINSVKYILQFYPKESTTRQNCIEYLLKHSSSNTSIPYIKVIIANLFIDCGYPLEQIYGKTIINNINNINNNNINNIKNSITLDEPRCFQILYYLMYKYTLLSTLDNHEEMDDTNSTSFLNITYGDVLYLIISYLNDYSSDSDIINIREEINNIIMNIQFESKQEFYQSCLSLLYTLDKICPHSNTELKMDLKDHLCTTFFRSYDTILHTDIPQLEKEAVLESIMSDNKTDIEYFLDYYSIEAQLAKEYTTKYNVDINIFTELYQELCIEYINQ